MKKAKVTYASLNMIRFLDRRGQRVMGAINNLERKTVVTRPKYIRFLASRLEQFDPGAKLAHKIALRYQNRAS